MPKPKKLAQADDDASIDLPRARVLGRGLRAGVPQRISLRALRVALGVTQVDIAEAAGVDQAEVSRMEQRSDVKLSTLDRYVKALGGTVEVHVVVNGRKFVLDFGG
jgi:DNA-binding Xre family transcriptional regulator